MPPKRGVAAVKKARKTDKYIYLDSDSEEISPPRDSGSESSEKENREDALPNAGRQGADDLLPGRKPKAKLSSEAPAASATTGKVVPCPSKRQAAHHHEQSPVQSVRLPKSVPAATPAPTEHTTRRPKTTTLSLRPAADQNPSPVQPAVEATTVEATTVKTTTVEPDPVNMSQANHIPSNQLRHMRACMVCSAVKTQQHFHQYGCPNCHFLELAGNMDQVQECTSQVFDGLITVSDTTKSWVARWQRLEGYEPGVYAVQVEGVLPEDALAAAENAGIHYVPRDGSVNEALPTDA